MVRRWFGGESHGSCLSESLVRGAPGDTYIDRPTMTERGSTHIVLFMGVTSSGVVVVTARYQPRASATHPQAPVEGHARTSQTSPGMALATWPQRIPATHRRKTGRTRPPGRRVLRTRLREPLVSRSHVSLSESQSEPTTILRAGPSFATAWTWVNDSVRTDGYRVWDGGFQCTRSAAKGRGPATAPPPCASRLILRRQDGVPRIR